MLLGLSVPAAQCWCVVGNRGLLTELTVAFGDLAGWGRALEVWQAVRELTLMFSGLTHPLPPEPSLVCILSGLWAL